MVRPIIYDGLRLFLGVLARAPRGIDRVDLGYARFLFRSWEADCFGLLPTPWGMRLYDRTRALRLFDTLETSWREAVDAGDDPVLDDLRQRLDGEHRLSGRTRDDRSIGRLLRFFSANGLALGHSASQAAPRDAIYLNIGQLGWAVPWTTRWLNKRPDVRAIFMLHDVIPLRHPDLVSRGGHMGHEWMLTAAARHAAGLITTTRAARDTVLETLRHYGRQPAAIASFHLPVAPVFLQREQPDAALKSCNYFIICGAIEPRKNHLLLLNVWLRLVRERGAAAPKLIIAGSPAHDGRMILRQFAQAPSLGSHVFVASGLSSPGLRRLMASAVALLAPSFAEGFGLPVVEAQAVGTLVLASDLAAHREAGGDLPLYLDPSDEAIWFETIARLIDQPEQTTDLRRRVATYRPLTEDDYFRQIKGFLESVE